MNPGERRCWDCGNVAMHDGNVSPPVLCKKCGSQDTRLTQKHSWSLDLKKECLPRVPLTELQVEDVFATRDLLDRETLLGVVWRLCLSHERLRAELAGAEILLNSEAIPLLVGSRVRIKFGVDRGHYGTIISKAGDNGTYYGVKLDGHEKPVGYSEYELDAA